MTFIRQHSRDFIERVRVRCILAQRHQEHGVFLSHAIIHSLLQRRLLRRHHVVIADDVVDFHGVGLAVLLQPANHQLKIIEEC